MARRTKPAEPKRLPRQKSQASNRPAAKRPAKAPGEIAGDWNERDEENKTRFIDQSGLAAQDLTEAAHGQNVMDHPSEMTRNLPHQHGGELGGEGGMRGDRNLGDAARHGGRKRN